MMLLGNGHVGFGTTNPYTILDTGTSTGKKIALFNSNFNSATGSGFYGFGVSASLPQMEFYANAAQADNADMVLNSSGYLGIGDLTPQSKLSVINTGGTGGYTYANVAAGFFSGAATGGVHGPLLGGDRILGNSFIQSGFNRTGYGYNLVLQPSTGNVGIGIAPDPAYKLEILGQLKCGNPANSLTALDIDTTSSYSYGILIGGWSAGGRINGNATIEMSTNLHIDSATVGAILLNWYNAGNSTFIRNRIDVSDRRIKKDIVEIETPEQFTETFEIIKKVGGYKYKYRDIYRENDLDQYGFIAQEVLKHYPVACKSTGDNCYLPNIMKTLNFTYEVGEENQYTFTIEGYDLDVNIKYLFYGFPIGVEQFDYLENIEPTTNNTFTYTPTIIKNEEPPIYVKLVLVGTYTDDKLGVNKDKLFQLSFSGIIGLIHENENMKKENIELKNRIDILEENQKKIIQKLNEISNLKSN